MKKIDPCFYNLDTFVIMIEIGKYAELEILRDTEPGLFLGDDEGDEVLLPNKYCPKEFEIGDMIEVYVYRDFAERKVATNIIPKIHLKEFALLECKDVTEHGAFMDWGMEKHLMVPFSEQRQNMELGRWYVVYMDLDEDTDRLFGSNKLNRYLSNESLRVGEGDPVILVVYKETELGYSVIVNNLHKGLVYKNETFKPLNIGDELEGYVKKIREENKLDISLQPIGYQNAKDVNCELIHQALTENDGFLPLTDKSTPDAISRQFGISKKAFKKAIGALYKERKITLESDGIKLV